jgi:Sulfotransferase family
MADDISFDEATLLIGLGAPRTGSKWLSNYFAQHSEILMSPIRVLNYFTKVDRFHEHFETSLREAERQLPERSRGAAKPPPPGLAALRDRARMNKDPDAFLEFFRKRWRSEKVFADVTPSYYAEGRDMFARMRDAHRKVRFFFVMRNPIDRYWSGMRLAQMHDSTFDPIARLDFVLTGRHPPWRRNYITTLMDLDAVVSSPDVKVAFFEELFDMTAISELCGFLGVGTQPADLSSAMNRSEGADLDAERRGRLYAKFEPVYRFVLDRYGRLPDSWLEDMDRFGVA